MTSIFVDTAALIALGNARDQFHMQAARLLAELIAARRSFVTTSGVILELTNALSAAAHKPLAIRMVDMITNSPNWTTVIVDGPLLGRGIDRFKQMDDKDWSLVDCIGMIVAEDAGITEIFTNDHHYQQAGFIILLKPDR